MQEQQLLGAALGESDVKELHLDCSARPHLGVIANTETKFAQLL